MRSGESSLIMPSPSWFPAYPRISFFKLFFCAVVDYGLPIHVFEILLSRTDLSFVRSHYNFSDVFFVTDPTLCGRLGLIKYIDSEVVKRQLSFYLFCSLGMFPEAVQVE